MRDEAGRGAREGASSSADGGPPARAGAAPALVDTVLGTLREGVLVHDAAGAVVLANAAAEAALGLAEDDLAAVEPAPVAGAVVREDGSPVPPEAWPHVRAIATGAPVGVEVLGVRRPDGSRAWLEAAAAPLGDPAAPHGAITTFTDITETRALGLEQAALRRITEAAAGGIATPALAELVTRELVVALDVAAARVVRFDRDGVVGVARHYAPDVIASAECCDDGEMRSRAPAVLRAGGHVRFTGLETGAEEAALGERAAVPLEVGGGLWGAVGVASRADERLPDGIEQRLADVARIAALAIASAEARAALVLQAARESAIARLGQLAAEGARPADVVHLAVRRVAEVLEAVEVAVLVWGADGALVPTAAVGLAAVDACGRLPRSRSVIARALADGRAHRTSRAGACGRPGDGAALACGIPTRKGVEGVIYATRRAPFADGDRAFASAVALVIAASLDRAASDDALAHVALHDPLTGLPNRALLVDRLEQALAASPYDDRHVALLLVDLDGFRELNERHGHAAGDAVLVECATRLEAILDPELTLARAGGDEFLVLLPRAGSAAEPVAVARLLLEALAPPLAVGRHRLHITASVGVALCDAESSPDVAIRDAEAAARRARGKGARGRVQVSDVGTREALIAHVALDADVLGAVARRELRVHYQPIIDLRTGEIAGCEALLRWAHPRHGLLGPDALIEAAERTGAIIEVGRFVLGQACLDAARMAAAARRPIDISVNLSAVQLADVGLVEHARACLGRSGVPASSLVLELTESALLSSDAAHLARLAALRALGVRLHLDDFGTGWSSLGYLQRLPIDGLKLDRTFVAGLGVDERATTIVAAVVQLAHALRLVVTAEGVERPDQAAALQGLGCAFAQGYRFARPLPRVAAIQLLRRGVRDVGAAD